MSDDGDEEREENKYIDTESDTDGIPWALDEGEMYQRMLESGTDVYEGILEAVQNSIDSILPPISELGNMTKEQADLLPNTISIVLSGQDEGNNTGLVIMDNGLSICKDYNYNIIKFIRAAKGKSPKSAHPYSIGRKGVGMFQLLQVAKKIRVVTCDLKNNGCIYTFNIFIAKRNGKEYPHFSKDPEIVAATSENMKRFGIQNNGTALYFEELNPDAKEITAKQIVDKIRLSFGLVMARKKNLRISVNDKYVSIPEQLVKHPEQHLQFIVDTKNGNQFELSGNIYPDEHGTGRLWIYAKGGQRTTEYPFAVPGRRCSGYVTSEEFKPTTDRKSIIENHEFKAAEAWIAEYVKRFEPVKMSDDRDMTDKKARTMAETNIAEALEFLLPKISAPGEETVRPPMELAKGNLNPTADEEVVPGYRPKNKETQGKGKKRGPYKKHTHRTIKRHIVGIRGKDGVMRPAEDYTPQQTKSASIWWAWDYLGDSPLLDAYFKQGKWIIQGNLDHLLYKEKILSSVKSTQKKLLVNDIAMLIIKYKQEVEQTIQKNLTLDQFRKYIDIFSIQVLLGISAEFPAGAI